MPKMPPLPTVLLLLLWAMTVGAQVPTFCMTGYIMDRYCINRGVLLDKPKLETLTNAPDHSVHCLVDVPACRHSGYELLYDGQELQGDAQGNCRAFGLSDYGNELVIQHARSIGDCTTCDGHSMPLEQGYRATVVGNIEGEIQGLPLINVTQILDYSIGCATSGGESRPTMVNCKSGKWQPLMIAHGILMMLGWGILLPLGVIFAKLLKHKPNALWFKLHRGFQISGLTCATAGFIIALVSFDVFAPGFSLSFLHGLLGIITMMLGCLQPLNAFFRPHVEADMERTKNRIMWEYLHKISGYTAVTLGLFTVLIGTTRIAPQGAQMAFLVLYILWVCSLVVIIVVLVCSQRKANPPLGVPASSVEATNVPPTKVEAGS